MDAQQQQELVLENLKNHTEFTAQLSEGRYSTTTGLCPKNLEKLKAEFVRNSLTYS